MGELPHGAHHPSAEDVAIDELTIDTGVAAALRRLSPRDARLLALVALEGYSATEAAGALGISPETARTRLHRVRAHVKRSLGHDTLDSYLTKEAT
ncbi:RNA polymerase sigma factor [Microbacterium sulfonylureivorans]|uniref:RNA polymerase sigma factor n=1 Tax=Microbacterium sulfonylureivorans TaxID=2486854 RepID=UPI0013DEF9FB|nr:sigma-70 family RNA polymerase sigma factor [Microbacterium sulfonylureivorans]